MVTWQKKQKPQPADPLGQRRAPKQPGEDDRVAPRDVLIPQMQKIHETQL